MYETKNVGYATKNRDMRCGVFHPSRKSNIMGIMRMSISLASLDMSKNNVLTTAQMGFPLKMMQVIEEIMINQWILAPPPQTKFWS